MLAAHAAAPDLEVVDEEGHRELVELLDDEGVGELAPEAHQVVGGDGAGDQQGHVGQCQARRKDYGIATRRVAWAYPVGSPYASTCVSAVYDELDSPARCTPTPPPSAAQPAARADASAAVAERRASTTTTSRARCPSARSRSARRRQRHRATRCTCTSTDRSDPRSAHARRAPAGSRTRLALVSGDCASRLSGRSRRRRRSRWRWGCRW